MKGRLALICLYLMLVVVAMAQEGLTESQRRGCRRGTWYMAETPTFKRKARQADASVSKYQGDRHQLLVLAAFSDIPFSQNDPVSVWNPIFNEPNFTESPFVGSVHDYFYDQSYGTFRLTFDIEYVVVGNVKRYASTAIDDEMSQFLVDDVLDTLLTRDIEWDLYDWDGDGMMDQLLILYAGYGMHEGNLDCIWPHQWWMSQHRNLLPGSDPATYRDPRMFTYDNHPYGVDCYCVINERSSRTAFHPFGTICHEYSHCFGFPDFYYGSNNYVGPWDLMDSGNSNGNGYCPPGYSAHERMLLGWLTPMELQHSTTVGSMPALCDEPVAYLVRNSGYEAEYYMIENRQKRKWDATLPSEGMTIFHVDYDEKIWKGVGQLPNEDKKPGKNRYTIIPANNNYYMSYAQGWAFPYEDNNQLTDTSTPAATLLHPNAVGDYLMGKPIMDIDIVDGLGTFRFVGGTTTIVSSLPHRSASGHIQIYDTFGRTITEPRRGTFYIVKNVDGTVEKRFFN